jgi:hypothetical protein
VFNFGVPVAAFVITAPPYEWPTRTMGPELQIGRKISGVTRQAPERIRRRIDCVTLTLQNGNHLIPAGRVGPCSVDKDDRWFGLTVPDRSFAGPAWALANVGKVSNVATITEIKAASNGTILDKLFRFIRLLLFLDAAAIEPPLVGRTNQAMVSATARHPQCQTAITGDATAQRNERLEFQHPECCRSLDYWGSARHAHRAIGPFQGSKGCVVERPRTKGRLLVAKKCPPPAVLERKTGFEPATLILARWRDWLS